jgi:uncharacterized protein YecT (DUF1311 family)
MPMQRRRTLDIKPKTAVFLTIIFFVLLVSDTPGQNSKETPGCFDTAKTQFALNNCAGKQSGDAELELNKTYQSILKKYADRPAFLERLRIAQRTWLRFRDAQLEMQFPPAEASGSVTPMCYALLKAELTDQRTTQLKAWLQGAEEGDVCYGSMKFRGELK